MKFFLDTANVEEIKEMAAMGFIDGVTTNPSLIAREGRDFKKTILEIAEIVDGPISAEVMRDDAEGMLEEGRKYAQWHKNIVIKVPMTGEGMKAVYGFKKENIRTNVTLIFSPAQALVAAKAGASFVSPFVGRLDDISHVGMEIIEKIVSMFRNYDISTEVLVASCRNTHHIVDAALLGADIATAPYSVFSKMLRHPLTDIGIQRFKDDWKKAIKS